ncbi:testis-expressed protein 10-like [Dendronephthya gigantea]|uniref:testis-expressed protein 10-like n=1 Tax=Dendronephthya gigantea TaxID=151771 RepID=UPI00106DA235|nr:testis-expressed protein 10-like [Dendronephthya gigantea]
MSKNKRKRRLKEEDFKKKKLKVGKKLPMPDNVTRTSFKAKNINISQQNLNNDGVQSDTNFKGQKLKDLLNLCSHYNTQAREDALLGLKDLFQKHPGILKSNLNAVLQRILSLTTDIESSVRKSFLAIISLVFKTLSETEILPFFSNVMAYLCSAMTHLNESIRLDSLKFLDLCLEHFPQLVKANPKNIIMNFINVISVEKSSVAKKSSIPVKIELKAKVTSQKAQLEVLSRLNHLLCIIFGNPTKASNGDCIQSTNNQGSEKLDDINLGIAKDTSQVTLSNVNPVLISNFSMKKTSSNFQSWTMDEKWLTELISCLSPVLFEYWVECCPAEFTMNLIPVTRSSVPLKIMKEVLEIFVTFVESLKSILDQSRFHEFLGSDLFSHFNSHFMKVFPLSFTLQQSGRKSKVDFGKSITDVELNILIARLLSFHIPQIKLDVKSLPKWASAVLAYLYEILASKSVTKQQSKLSASDIKSLSELAQMFLLNLPERFENEKVCLLESMFQLYESCRVSSSAKMLLLEFLAEVMAGTRNQTESMKAILDEWLKSLLKIVNMEISEDMKYILFSVCKTGILQGFPHLTNAMVEASPVIFNVENFSKLTAQVQKLVIEILYHIGTIPSQELFKTLARLCASNCMSLQVFKYLLFVVHQLVHSTQNDSLVSDLSDYLSFILSIAIGHTQEKLEHIQSLGKGQPNCYNYKEINGSYTVIAQFEGEDGSPQVTQERWKHVTIVIELIWKFVAQSDYSTKFLNVLESPLCMLFQKYQTLPLEVVYRLLYLVKILVRLSEGETDCNKLLTFISTWCAVLWHFSLNILNEFGTVPFIHDVTNSLKTVTIELCKSESILKQMLGLFIPSTMPGHNPQLASQVLTDVLKEARGNLMEVHMSTLEDLYKNLEGALTIDQLNSQVFADFKYQYQISTRCFMVCD